MTSSIFFFSSWLRSRTRRGSLDQALPIGCMRVFMTPSCSSDVTWLRRCSGPANSLSFCLRRICSSWLRVSTSSLTIVIRFSSSSTLTRMLWLATALSLVSASLLAGRGHGGGSGDLGRGRLGFRAGAASTATAAADAALTPRRWSGWSRIRRGP